MGSSDGKVLKPRGGIADRLKITSETMNIRTYEPPEKWFEHEKQNEMMIVQPLEDSDNHESEAE